MLHIRNMLEKKRLTDYESFLVEDEVVIRNGIKNCIDWEKEGFEFVGQASDGELAYPQILKTKPDVLITDSLKGLFASFGKK